MASKPKIRGRIPAGELAAVKPWALPSMEAKAVKEVPLVCRNGPAPVGEVHEDEVEAKPITLKELEQIRAQAFEEGFKEGRDAGHQEGHAAGVASGYQEGLTKGAAEISAKCASLAAMTKSLEAPLAAQDAELEAVLLRLVMEMGKAALKAELKLSPEHLLAALQDVLQALPQQQEPIKLRVHPQNQPLLEQAKAEQGADWSIEADAKQPLGGITAISGLSLLEYSLEGAFEAQCQQLLERRLSKPDTPAS